MGRTESNQIVLHLSDWAWAQSLKFVKAYEHSGSRWCAFFWTPLCTSNEGDTWVLLNLYFACPSLLSTLLHCPVMFNMTQRCFW